VLLVDLPDWLPAWCLDHLGSGPAAVLFQVHQVSMVIGLRLADGTDVVVKARADDGRAASCAAACVAAGPAARLGPGARCRRPVCRSSRGRCRRYMTARLPGLGRGGG
jgi:hypothetical protein